MVQVSLFVTCLADTLFPTVAQDTVTVLEHLGCTVNFDPAQSCCGQLHLNTGYPQQAGELVRSFADTFAGAEAVVLPSGSCAAMLRQHGTMVAPEAELPPIYELSEFIVDVIGVEDVGARFPHAVTYHPSCHSRRLLGLGDRPYRLLRAVDGLKLRDLPDDDQCCGFGGTFAVKNADVSAAMGTDKLTNAVSTGAEYLCAPDASCLMHLQGLIDKQRQPIQTIHLATILASR